MTEGAASFSKETIQFYKEYTGVNDVHNLENHLMTIQQKLAKQGRINYRCIQRFKFAFSRIYERFFYKDLIKLGQTLEQQHQKPYFLDIGCCTGTDLRKMMLDGYPKNYLIGMDIEQCYIDCGYELFKDNPDTCPIRFIIDDLFTFQKTHVLCDTISIVHAGSVLHLFDLDQIVQFIHRATWLLKIGGILVGGHVCADRSTQYFRQATKSLKYYMAIDEFEQILIKEGFTDIRMETQPRIAEEDDEERDFTAYWVSFYAVYNPIEH
ncbi:60S ribosomal protein L37B [Mucor velutinosus]|uniref:60S ribosomal protein L37B n=1 Tax=Mucor velutinosus TaxID=708070 RepID=A0AAN7HMX7_9FUNG|nr:60S ribosomal protein L37B [Mucor velutinosus]